MTDIAGIGRRHLADALTGKMNHCEVTEWVDDTGKPVTVYWRPLTGAEQRTIDQASTEVDKVCNMVKHRARDAGGALIFADTPLASLANDYDYDVIRAIAFIIAGNIGQDEKMEAIEKE